MANELEGKRIAFLMANEGVEQIDNCRGPVMGVSSLGDRSYYIFSATSCVYSSELRPNSPAT